MYMVTFDKIENGSILCKSFPAKDMNVVLEMINQILKDFPHIYTLTGIYKKTA